MKSSNQIFTALITTLATIGQLAIATSVCAAPKDIINSDIISIGTKTRTNLLSCSRSSPCKNGKIVIDSYKEKFSSNGILRGANIVIYNTSFAPAAIEVYGSDGALKNVDFVDGATAGFKDLGEFNKAVLSGLIEPFQCTTDLFKCLSDPRYGIEKNERTINLQSGDLIKISAGSDAAHAYTSASSLIDLIELMKSIPGVNTSKVKFPALFQEYSKELRRKIVRKFIIDKIREKYTWEMLVKELGYESFKRTASNSQDLFDNSLEIIKNVPQDFWKNLEDGTIPSTASGDFLDTLIPMVSAKASIYLSSAFFGSQSVGIRARFTASETAHNKPFYVIVAGLNNSSTSKPVTAKPNNLCTDILAQIKSSLTNVTRFEISNLSKYDGIPPQGKTQHLTIISSGTQGSASLAMGTKIITSCSKIGSVRFVANGTDDQSVYGLLNGKVQLFKCRSIDNPSKWGQYACS